MITDKKTINLTELLDEELDQIAGGHPFEDCFGDNDLHRAGVTYINTVFGNDEYYICSTHISKDLARSLRERSRELWKQFSSTGDYVAYARIWKQILADEYGISWDGQMGKNSFQWGA